MTLIEFSTASKSIPQQTEFSQLLILLSCSNHQKSSEESQWDLGLKTTKHPKLITDIPKNMIGSNVCNRCRKHSDKRGLFEH